MSIEEHRWYCSKPISAVSLSRWAPTPPVSTAQRPGTGTPGHPATPTMGPRLSVMALVGFHMSSDQDATAEAAPRAGARRTAEVAAAAAAAASAAAGAAATAAGGSTFSAAAAVSAARHPAHTFHLSYPPPAATVVTPGAAPPLVVPADSPLHLCTNLWWGHVRDAARRRLMADPTQWAPPDAALSSNDYLLGSATLLREILEKGTPSETAEMKDLRSWQRAWLFVFARNDDTDRTAVRYALYGTNSQTRKRAITASAGMQARKTPRVGAER